MSKEALKKMCDCLSHEKAVTNSKQLLFRFLIAYRELTQLKNGRVSKVLDALENTVVFSAVNTAGYRKETKVVIAADLSGSMQQRYY